MRIIHVDAFTDKPFTGNPAAVCIVDPSADERWMQNVAREMNLSETAFLVARPGTDSGYDLRWFTPTVEVDLCGHATLASAHVLWEDGHVTRGDPIRFHTRVSGVLGAERDGEWIELDFPARPVKPGDVPDPVLEAVGGNPIATALGDVGGGSGYLLEYADEDEVRGLEPNFSALRSIPDGYVIVTAPSSSIGYDFVSRFFAPPAGIDEDPVTGAAHCALGPWWAERLGKADLMAFQASARGGTVRVRVQDDRVLLGGRAVTVLRGELV